MRRKNSFSYGGYNSAIGGENEGLGKRESEKVDERVTKSNANKIRCNN